ncbi:MAG: MinD/ParA family protein [Halobacteriaceae archaeon]
MIVAVCGGKGGVGKSTLAYNLAAAVDGTVVDADLGMADLPGDRGRGPDLHDVLAGRADPLEAVTDRGAVTLLPCGRSLAGARATDPTALGDALDAVARVGGPVLVDCPAGMNADAGLPLYAADACILVTTPDRPAVADALRTRELARELDAGLCRVAVNRATGATPRSALERAVGAKSVEVPASPVLGRSLAAGDAAVRTAPDAPAAAAIQTLADGVQSCTPR